MAPETYGALVARATDIAIPGDVYAGDAVLRAVDESGAVMTEREYRRATLDVMSMRRGSRGEDAR